MRFADGLPINLKYPVLPKPKPPLPLFSTMPRSSHKKSHDAIDVPQNLQSPPEHNTQNMNLASQKHTQMLSTKKKSKEHTTSVFSTLRLRSPKKSSILDSMSTLKKSKHKRKNDSEDDKANVCISDEKELKQAESLLKDLSFSTDFSSLNKSTENIGIVNVSDEFYNVPKNNAPISNDPILTNIEDAKFKISSKDSKLEIETKTEEEVDYLTKSDIIIERERNNNKTCNER